MEVDDQDNGLLAHPGSCHGRGRGSQLLRQDAAEVDLLAVGVPLVICFHRIEIPDFRGFRKRLTAVTTQKAILISMFGA